MKRTAMVVAGLVLVTALLAGCSSMSRKGDPSALRSSIASEYDVAYMQRINAQARARGDIVIWVNPPQAEKVATETR